MTSGESMSIEKIGIKWGIVTFFLLSAFFLIMRLAGFASFVDFRFLNALIMFFGCYRAIRTAKRQLKIFSYFKGLGSGSLTALISTGLFTVTGLVYLTLVNPEFIIHLKKSDIMGLFFTNVTALIQVFIEGIISGFIFSLVIMQWMKEPRITSEE